MISASKNLSGEANFKLAADIDFLSFLLCCRATLLTTSTHAWLVAHSIEKYLKAILEQNDISIPKGRDGHDIDKLWKSSSKFIEQSELFDKFILNINTLKTEVRYVESMITTTRDFCGFYLAFATHLRYVILGKEEYQKRDYGLEVDLVFDKNVLNMIKQNLKFLLEDKVAYSAIGIPDKININLPHLIQKS